MESAVKAVTEKLFRDFDNTLRSFCDGENNRKTIFRILRYARMRLHGLCECISKEETPESSTRIRFLHIVIGFFGEIFGIQLNARSLYDAYADIKRRKGGSRPYFLDKMPERLNLRMQRDDEKEREWRR